MLRFNLKLTVCIYQTLLILLKVKKVEISLWYRGYSDLAKCALLGPLGAKGSI